MYICFDIHFFSRVLLLHDIFGFFLILSFARFNIITFSFYYNIDMNNAQTHLQMMTKNMSRNIV